MGTVVNPSPAVTVLEKQRPGYIAMSWSNSGTTAEPQFRGYIEVSGSLVQFPTLEGAAGWSSISVSTSNIYIKCVTVGLNVTLEYTTTAPVWNNLLQGWYSPTGGQENQRYLNFILDKSSAGNYENKRSNTLSDGGSTQINDILGMVASFAFKNTPGWLYCDGSTISNIGNPEYSRLVSFLKIEAGTDVAHPYYHADADKAVLPDLQGAIARGVDTAATRDKDGLRKSGNYQVDENKSHRHDLINGVTAAGSLWGINNIANSFSVVSTVAQNLVTLQGDTEATVKNIALYYLIKY